MKNKNLTPLQILRAEKREVKRQYTADGERLSQNWNYLTNNVGSILINSVVVSAKGMIGGNKTKEKASVGSKNLPVGSILSGISASLPILWEFAQPMLIGYAVKKVKSFFTPRKKKEDTEE